MKVEHTKLFIEIIYMYEGVKKKDDNFVPPRYLHEHSAVSLGGQQLHYPLCHSVLHLVLFFLLPSPSWVLSPLASLSLFLCLVALDWMWSWYHSPISFPFLGVVLVLTD